MCMFSGTLRLRSCTIFDDFLCNRFFMCLFTINFMRDIITVLVKTPFFGCFWVFSFIIFILCYTMFSNNFLSIPTKIDMFSLDLCAFHSNITQYHSFWKRFRCCYCVGKKIFCYHLHCCANTFAAYCCMFSSCFLLFSSVFCCFLACCCIFHLHFTYISLRMSLYYGLTLYAYAAWSGVLHTCF